MADSLTIAALQHHSTPGDIAASLERYDRYMADAKRASASLLIVPEASLTGYNNALSELPGIAEAANGNAADVICALCRKHNIAIAYGFAEKDGDAIYNSVQFIDEHGIARALYRKTHLWGEQDRTLFTEGQDLHPGFTWHGWRLGFLICYDIEFPESVRRLALDGTELLINPTALMTPWTRVADDVVPVRAFENQLFIAYVNFCGAEYEQQYVGRSCIAAPNGDVLAKACEEEELLIATISKTAISDARKSLPYFRDRRPELYRVLVSEKSSEPSKDR